MGRYTRISELGEVGPGKMKCIDVAGRRILLANVGGSYYATDDTCTHEEASLATGALHGTRVTCPLHGSRFDLRTGMPLEEPAEEPLRCYPLRVADGAVYVELP